MIVTIIYNEFNIDSVMATIALKRLISDKYKTENNDEFVIFSMVSTQRDLLPNQMAVGQNHVYIVGVELSKQAQQIIKETNCGCTCYSYNESQSVIKEIGQIKPIDDGIDLETSKNNSVFSLVMSDARFESQLMFMSKDIQTKLFEIGYIAYKHWNYKRLGKNEMIKLFSVFDTLQNSAKSTVTFIDFEIPDTTIDSDKLFKSKVMESTKIKLVRGLVERNLTSHQFGDSRKSKVLPTVNVPREFLHDAVRIIGLCHEKFIVYEDVKTERFWYIKSNKQSLSQEIAKMIPHSDAWFDGKLLCLRSELPSFHK